MNLSLNLSLDQNTTLHKKSNFLIYTIEKGDTPYLYYHMIKNINNYISLPSIYLNKISDSTHFMDKNFTQYDYKGTLLWNDENFIFYEINLNNVGFTPTYDNDSWWRVTPYELIYTHTVLMYLIDQYYISFFKSNPETLFVFNDSIKYETPIIGYIGVDESELNQQILLSDINYRKGYHFGSIEESYFQSLYADLSPNEDLIKLINHNYIHTMSSSNEITIKNNKFHLNNIYIGAVPPNCGGKFTLHYFNENFIYLKGDKKLKKCITHDYYIKRKTPGCIIRYVLFLKKTSISPKMKKGYNSYCYGKNAPHWFPTYVVKEASQFSEISYHWSTDSNLDPEYITRRDKDTLIRIK